MKNNLSHPCMWQQGHTRCYRLAQSVVLTALLGIGTVQAGQPFITTSLSTQIHSVAMEQQTGNYRKKRPNTGSFLYRIQRCGSQSAAKQSEHYNAGRRSST